MAKDIEEFLRMAAAKRKQALNQEQTQQQPPQQQRAVPPPRQPLRRTLKPEIEIIDDGEVVDLRDQSVAAHVRSHIQTSEIAAHAEQLGSRVSSARDAVESRISQKFDHDVGHLNLRPTEGVAAEVTRSSTDDVSPIAAHLVSLLTNAESIRSAIVLNEVLKRPDFD